MRTALMFAICVMGLCAVQARAEDNGSDEPKETVTQFLARCDAGDATCRSDLKYGFEAAADDMGIICPPDDLSEESAVEAELAWLRNAAASNATLAGGDEVDAEYTALNTLWPCGN